MAASSHRLIFRKINLIGPVTLLPLLRALLLLLLMLDQHSAAVSAADSVCIVLHTRPLLIINYFSHPPSTTPAEQQAGRPRPSTMQACRGSVPLLFHRILITLGKVALLRVRIPTSYLLPVCSKGESATYHHILTCRVDALTCLFTMF